MIKQQPSCAVAAFTAIVAVVYIVSECLVRRSQVPATPKLVGRRLSTEEGGDKESLRDKSTCEALQEEEKGEDAISPEEPFHATRSSGPQGRRRARAKPRRRRHRGKTLATLRILEQLLARDAEQTEKVDPEEPASRGSPSKVSPGSSTSTPENEGDSEEEWKGPGKPDHLLELFMERAKRTAEPMKKQEQVGAAVQPSSRAETISLAAPVDTLQPGSPPPPKRSRGGDSEGVLAASQRMAVAPRAPMEQHGTSARDTSPGKKYPVAPMVVDELSLDRSLVPHRPDWMVGTSSDISSEDELFATEFLDAYLSELLETEASGSLADWMLEPSQGIPSDLFLEAEAEIRMASESSKGGDSGSLMDAPAPSEPSEVYDFPLRDIRGSSRGNSLSKQRNVVALGSLFRGVSAEANQGPSPAEAESAFAASLHPTSSVPTGDAFEEHPFYKLPEQFAGTYSPSRYLAHQIAWRTEGSLPRVLSRVRQTLAKPALNPLEVAELLTSGETLIHYASKYLGRPLESAWSAQLARPLAMRFLVANYLWCIRHVVGAQRATDFWLPTIMEKLLASPQRWKYKDGIDEKGRSQKNLLVQGFVDALTAFRSGTRPGAEQIVWLMRQIFCSPSGMSDFRGPEWDGWREADDDFVKSQQASEQGRNDGGT
ncbi:hypothetical protein ACSSS7_007491 [Eimeria intestinalis]